MPKAKSILIIFILISIFIFFNILNEKIKKPVIHISKQDSAYLLKQGPYLNLIPFPKSLLSSLIWINTLLESDLQKHYQADENSWIYYRFMTMAQMEPFFYENYFIGGKYLSIIKDDVWGADHLYTKGLRIYKHDFWLLINSGFNKYFELGEIKKAIKLYERANILPERVKHFPIMPSLLAKLKREDGLGLEDIYKLIQTAYQKEQVPVLKERYKEALYSLKAEKDLRCLNIKAINCDRFDFFGNPYIRQNGQFKAERKWKKFELSDRAKKKGR